MIEDKPYIGICLASYNGEKYIAEQLESIFSQTYQQFKLYIADDLSTDNTVTIIKTFQERFSDRINLTVNDTRLGVVRNFETLMTHCEEAYITLADQDDIWESDKLALQLEAMIKLENQFANTACLVHSDLTMIDEKNKVLADSYYRFRGYVLEQKKDLGHILGPSGVMGNTLMINRLLYDKAFPFPPGLEVHDYWIGIITELYGRRQTLQVPLVRYRIHNNNVSNSMQSIQSKEKRSQWLSRDIKLPYLESSRHRIMAVLLKREMGEEDKKSIQSFYEYLTFSKGRMDMYYDLIHYSLVKQGVWFRVKLFVKMMLTKRYPYE